MKNSTFLFTLLLLTFHNIFYSQSNKNQEKIGIVFKIEGPYKIHREAFYNILSIRDSVNKNDKYYDAINFLKTEKANPTEKLKEYYINQMKLRGYDLIVVNENLNKENFPVLNSKKRKQFDLDITILKKNYNIDKILIVAGKFGLEFEDLGDKRTNISLTNFIVDTNNNEISKEFHIGGIKNIKKKNLINPPDYPNIVLSMNRLLNEIIFPKIKSELESL